MALDWDALVGAPVMQVMGDAVEYAPVATGIYAPVATAVYDQPHVDLYDDRGQPAGSVVRPVIGVRLEQLPSAPAQNDRVYVSVANGQAINKTFVVSDVRPDGLGWALLDLTEMGAGKR